MKVKFNDKPLLLSAALILSTAGSSIAALAYLSGAVFFGQTKIIVEELTNIQTTQNISPIYLLIFCVLYIISLTGVIKMWKSKKAGYYFYVAAQLILLIVPLLWMEKNAFSVTNTVFTLLFIGIYSMYLKTMKSW